MKPLRSVLDDLVQRRLWPVAVLLAVAIAAVPLLLSKSSAPASATTPPTAPATTADAGLATDTAVVETPASGRGLSSLHRRDPFAAHKPKTPVTGAGASTGTSPGSGSTPGGAGSETVPGGGGSAGGTTSSSDSSGSTTGSVTPSTGGSTTGSTTGSVTPSTGGATNDGKKPHDQQGSVPAVSLDLAFGRVSSPLARHAVLRRLSPLPNRANPVVIFLGVRGKGTAVLLVSSEATPVGDGTCHPSPKDCQTVWLHAGQTEFFKVEQAAGDTVSYQLNLKRVHVKPGAKAKASAATVGGPHGLRWRRLAGRLGMRDSSGFDGVEAGVQALDSLAVSNPDDPSAQAGAPATGGDVILP